MTTVRSFLPSEIALAAGLAIIIEGSLFLLVATAANKTQINKKEDVVTEPTPIEVKPVLDELPLLKLGSKRVKAKLPDMWTKKPPVIKRYEAASAPSPKAEQKPEKIPDTPLVKPSAEPPPPDASIAKKVDQILHVDAGAPKPPANLPTEGSEDGTKEGTETDPLKAMVKSQYKAKISAWFNARFKRPTDVIPCDELKKLRASVSASVGGDRNVTGYSLTKSSGNATFDDRVKSTMDSVVSSGAELPPPPPNYPDILGTTIAVGFLVPSCD